MDSSGERMPLLSSSGQCGRSSLGNRLAAAKLSDYGGKTRFDVLFLKRFWYVMRVAFPKLCSKSSLLLILLVFTRAAEEYNYYLAGLIPSKFYGALDSNNVKAFKESLWTSAVIVTYVCVCKSAREMVAGLLYVRWRALITRFLHSQYFKGINYYLLNVVDHKIDNPDQRITQDVDRLCQQLSDVVPKIIISPFIIGYYTYKTYQGMGYLGPVSIYGFFVVSTVINKFIMGPIVSLVVRQERLEGNFRFHHVQVRSNAESVAFYQGGNIEGRKANRLLQVLLRTQLSVVHWQFPLNVSVNIFDYMGSIISYSLIGIAVFSGKYDGLTAAQLSSVISQNSFFSIYLINNFSTLVDTAISFTDIAGYTHRIGELLEVLRGLNYQQEQDRGDNESGSSSPSEDSLPRGGPRPGHASINSERCSIGPQCVEVAASLKDLSLAPPEETTPLIESLNLEFRKGRNILILGDSGSGKSSILRVLRKLWKPLEGSAKLCGDDSHHYVLFLPQKPYLTSGSLADQVAFPENAKEAAEMITYQGAILSEDRITEALRMTGLIPLRDRLGGSRAQVEQNWYDIVSPGETQKIAFARLFFHKPPFAILDEATCALSEECEHYFYTSLQQLGITVMSVGHRSSLKKYHHQILKLGRNKTWQLLSQDLETPL